MGILPSFPLWPTCWPQGLSLADCDEAIAAAKAAGVSLMLGHVRQFDSGDQAAKARIDAGDNGRPIVFRAIAGDQDPPPPSFADPNVSGGLITDAGYHNLYLAQVTLRIGRILRQAQDASLEEFVARTAPCRRCRRVSITTDLFTLQCTSSNHKRRRQKGRYQGV